MRSFIQADGWVSREETASSSEERAKSAGEGEDGESPRKRRAQSQQDTIETFS